MDSVNAFRLDLSLKNFAKIALAVSFWEKDDVKRLIWDRLDSFNEYNQYFIYDPYLPPEWPDKRNETDLTHREMINYIFELLRVLKLSRKLSDEIKVLITKIGQKIYYWRQYVGRTLNIDTNWAHKIYWTSCGDIDELKIIQEFWLKNLTFPNCYCSKETEGKHFYDLEGMRHRDKRDYKHFHRAKNEIFWEDQTAEAVVVKWMWFWITISHDYEKDKVFDFCIPDTFNEFKASFDQLPAKHLLIPFVDIYFEFGVKYTWKRLTTSEKNVMVAECAKKCLIKISFLFDRSPCKSKIADGSTTNCWEKEKALKLLLFFINEMTEIQRSEFLEKELLSVYKVTAGIWPYQELCGKILKAFPDCVSKHHSGLLELHINRLISGFRSHRKPMHVTNQKFYYSMLLILFHLVPKSAILNFFVGDNFKIIKKILRKFNYDTLNFILKNVDLKDYKNEILEIGMHDFKQLLCRGRFTVFHEIIQNLKLSDSELKLLKRKFDLLTNFLTLGDFESADEYLNWRCDTKHEKNQIKNQVDAVQICSGFVLSDNFETANNFLIWRFDKKDERKKIKKALNLTGTTSETDFIRNKIFYFKTPEKCNELLKWFFDSKKDITEFRKTKIIQDDFFFEEYWDTTTGYQRFSSLDKFLIEVCLMSSGEYKTFKIKTANKINWFIDTFALGKCKFEMVDNLVSWIYKNKDDQRNIIRKYMDSPRGVLLCIKMFEKYHKEIFNHDENEKSFLCEFFGTWFDNGVDYSELRTSLNKCNNNDLVSVHTLECIKLFLHQIKKNGFKWNVFRRIGDHKSDEIDLLYSSDEDE